MPDRSDDSLGIPAFIKSLLDPFVDVRPGREARSTKKLPDLEITYIPPFFRLNAEQLQAIGRVSTTWAVLEHVIEIMLARLCMAPQFPALALTNDLGLDNRIKALKTLLALHQERYGFSIIPGPAWEELNKLPAKIATLLTRAANR